MVGGLVAASASEWNEVSTIQATGAKKTRVITQAVVVQTRPPPFGQVALSAGRLLPAVQEGAGPLERRCAHRACSSRKSELTTRSAKVATMIVPITVTTPAAAASPYWNFRKVVR